MKFSILLIALVFGACLVQDTEAWRGRGGYFGGMGRFGGGGFGGRWGGGYGRWGGGLGGWGLGLGRWGAGYGGWGLGISPFGFYSPYGSYGYRYFRDTMSHGNINQRVDCNFNTEKSLLACQGPSGGIECEVIANFTGLGDKKDFELYGIGNLWKVQKDVPVEKARFNLYPRLLNNTAWLNHTVAVENRSISLNLFHSPSYNSKFFGYRVVDLKCYERFVKLFHSVPAVNYENVTIVNAFNGPAFNVSLFGEILVQKPTKV